MINLNKISYNKNPEPKGKRIKSCIFSFYWLFDHQYKDDWEPEDWEFDIKDSKGQTIERVNGGVAKRILMEGSARLPSGKLVNLQNSPKAQSDPRKSDAVFREVDPESFPWGYDSQSGALEPWKSLASDPKKIPYGSKVYIPLFDSMEVLNPKTNQFFCHDGMFMARDFSWSFKGFWIDLFTGNYAAYKDILKKIDPLVKTKKIKNTEGQKQEQYYTDIFLL